MTFNNQPDWKTYQPTIKEELYECEVCDTKTKTQTKTYGCMDMEICKDCLDKEEKLKKKKKKKLKIVIKNKPNFEEEFKKWNDFNTEWLKYYNFFRLRIRFNNKSVEEMKELCDTIGYEVLEKQKQSNTLKTNTWCKTLLNMEAEEQNRTALKTYSILKKYDNQIKGIRKIIQKAVNTNMVN